MAALAVGGVAMAVGLLWWVAVAIALVSLLGGAALAAWLFRWGDRSTATPTPVVNAEGQSVFRLEGEFWTISYRGGATIHLPRSKGLRYIDRLLRSPNVEVHVLDLAAIHQPTAVPGPREGLQVQGPTAQPIIDQEALRQYRLRVDDLRDQLDEAERNGDPERASRARVELEQVLDEIREHAGHDRRFAEETEKARLNVTRAIRSAIEKIDDQDPSLGHHLDHDIRTGTYCVYEPDAATAPVWVH